MFKQTDHDRIYALMRTTNSAMLALIGMEEILGRAAHGDPPLREKEAYLSRRDDLATLTAELRDGVLDLYQK